MLVTVQQKEFENTCNITNKKNQRILVTVPTK